MCVPSKSKTIVAQQAAAPAASLPQPPPAPPPPQPVAERLFTQQESELQDASTRSRRRASRSGLNSLRIDLNVPSRGPSLSIPQG